MERFGVDPSVSLAISLTTAPGAYAMFLGSGVSRVAGIPTGWEVTLDLVRKAIGAEGADTSEDPLSWYRERFDKDPDYSEVVNGLARSQAERPARYLRADPVTSPDPFGTSPRAIDRDGRRRGAHRAPALVWATLPLLPRGPTPNRETTPFTPVAFSTAEGTGMCNASMAESATCPEGQKLTMGTVRKNGFTPYFDQPQHHRCRPG